jgi:hypothetical protein
MTLRKVTCLGAALLCGALLASGCATEPACRNFQSPRNLDLRSQPPPVYRTSRDSLVGRVGPDTIEYLPRGGGRPQILRRCSQHYHYPIEDPQGCPGELPPRGTPGTLPPPGEWVEVHTAYAARVAEVCIDPESTDCCLEQPVLVRAFSAKVTADGPDGPIVEPTGRPLFEWSGSTTSPDKEPNECKKPAEWSFRLSCDLTVSEAQLRRFRRVDKARDLQTGDRLSRDLTLVQP